MSPILYSRNFSCHSSHSCVPSPVGSHRPQALACFLCFPSCEGVPSPPLLTQTAFHATACSAHVIISQVQVQVQARLPFLWGALPQTGNSRIHPSPRWRGCGLHFQVSTEQLSLPDCPLRTASSPLPVASPSLVQAASTLICRAVTHDQVPTRKSPWNPGLPRCLLLFHLRIQ